MAELEATFGPNVAVDDTDQGVSFANCDLQINFAQVVDSTNTYGNGNLRLEGSFVSNFPDGLLIRTDIIGGETKPVA
jgi:hypothetical protein